MGLLQDLANRLKNAPANAAHDVAVVAQALQGGKGQQSSLPNKGAAVATLLGLQGNATAPQQQQQAPSYGVGPTHPGFQFTANPNHGAHQEGWQFVGGKQPIQTPQAQSPQNIHSNLSVYGDAQGNKWYEDDNTGQRFPITQPHGGDQVVRPFQPFDRFASAAPQYQSGPAPTPRIKI